MNKDAAGDRPRDVFFMFPGQGSQVVGMGKKLCKDFSCASRVFEEASEAVSLDLKRLCFEDSDQQLALTAFTQPALLTTSVAVWRVLCQETEMNTRSSRLVFAGHSLGEYSALVASEKLSLSSAVKLVRQRGLAMQDAVPVGVGSMAAVMGMLSSDLEALCLKHSQKGSLVCLANDNCPTQKVIAGHKTAVDNVLLALKDPNLKGVRAIPLKVSAPFHTPLMKPARDVMTPHLAAAKLLENENSIVANVDAHLYQLTYTRDLLEKQIDHPVRWTETLQKVEALAVQVAVEVGPGKVLCGLADKTFAPDSRISSMASDQIKDVIAKLVTFQT